MVALAVAGCTGVGGDAAASGPPIYEGVDTVLLGDGLVNLRVTMTGEADRDAVVAYSRCAAAQFTIDAGFGFARQIRTQVAQSGGRWEADAVYTVSAGLPAGSRTIDAEVTVADCLASGIPTV